MTSTNDARGLRERRAAANRTPPLPDGRRDPFDPERPEAAMRPEATAATIALLRSLGFTYIPVQRGDLRAMWNACAPYHRLAAEQAERNARYTA
ncbi:hypothetical protein CLV43_10332 [Umezawaea tangerina]|uniref:Uncharacterized protein n=2 Tax=Umezawaea tangerina TaxID=84725 RepID=A0A2T0TC99_9PSEU|nr:hypothetical protein CLV43_10332 [Umezawaea tangerina]